MISRIDQQIRVNKIMIDTMADNKIADKRIRQYTTSYLDIITTVTSVMLIRSGTEENLEKIFAKRKQGEMLTKEEELKFKTAFMAFAAEEYTKRNWAMQLHYGCRETTIAARYAQLGPDTGYDCINNYAPSSEMADMLNALSDTDALPKTILYSLNPNDNDLSEQSSDASRMRRPLEESSRVVHGGLMITKLE